MLLSQHQKILMPKSTTAPELKFEYGQQTIPGNWQESYDYAWNLSQSTGYGIVPAKDGNR